MPASAARTAVKRLCWLAINLSHLCGGVLRLSSVQSDFNTDTLECSAWTAEWFMPKHLGLRLDFYLLGHSKLCPVSYCWIMSSKLTWDQWVLPFFRWCSSVTSWISHWCALEVILVSQPFLGMFTPAPSFLYVWIMALSKVQWSTRALDTAFFLIDS